MCPDPDWESLLALEWSFSLTLKGFSFVANKYFLRTSIQFGNEKNLKNFIKDQKSSRGFNLSLPEVTLIDRLVESNDIKNQITIFNKMNGFLASLAITQVLFSILR